MASTWSKRFGENLPELFGLQGSRKGDGYLQAKGPLGGKVAAEQVRGHRMLTARWREREERTFARG